MADPTPTSYDEMPYINKAFPQTHPDRIGTIARLFGLLPPDPETCRVLELVCASGANLIPMAVELPHARFVGIDLSQRQVEHARLEAQRDPTVTNLRHEPVALNDLHRRLLPLLDGTRDIDALVAALVDLAKQGVLGVRTQAGGPVVTDAAMLENALRQTVAAELPALGRSALLLA